MKGKRRPKARANKSGEKRAPASGKKERIHAVVREWASKGLKLALVVASLVFFLLLIEQASDPSIDLKGKVIDEEGRPIENAYIEWYASSDDAWKTWEGVDLTDRRGSFRVYRRRMQGTSLTLTRIAAKDHHALAPAGEFKFFKQPYRMVPDSDDSCTFVLRRK